MSRSKFPGWRTMTAAQRYNARKDSIFDEARRLGAFDVLNRKADDEKTVAERKWMAPSQAPKPQKACDHGLFGDDKNQTDLLDLAK